MSQITVYILFNGYQREVKVSKTDSVRSLMTKAFEEFDISPKYYGKDKYQLTVGIDVINKDENELNKTLEEVYIEEDAVCCLINVSAVQWGQYFKLFFKEIK